MLREPTKLLEIQRGANVAMTEDAKRQKKQIVTINTPNHADNDQTPKGKGRCADPVMNANCGGFRQAEI